MKYAAVIDIGTTNIQALSLNLSRKKEEDYLTFPNSQAVYGSDVITRLGQSLKSNTLQGNIKQSVIKDLDRAVSALIRRRNINPADLAKIVVCGNAAMHHIMLGLPLDSLARAPFEPVSRRKIVVKTSNDVGIAPKGADFIFLPNIGGFAGSDALSVIVETNMHESDSPILAVDLGTNGELILGSREKMLVATSAAGSAFSDWHISCGIKPSEMIDVVSDLFSAGEITESGLLKQGEVKRNVNGMVITLTRKDIRAFQLAKAAISAGIEILTGRLSVKTIKAAVFTGVFGSSINMEKARNVNLIPHNISIESIETRERCALEGAAIIAQREDIQSYLDPILAKIEHVRLAEDRSFNKTFTDAIKFTF